MLEQVDDAKKNLEEQVDDISDDAEEPGKEEEIFKEGIAKEMAEIEEKGEYVQEALEEVTQDTKEVDDKLVETIEEKKIDTEEKMEIVQKVQIPATDVQKERSTKTKTKIIASAPGFMAKVENLLWDTKGVDSESDEEPEIVKKVQPFEETVEAQETVQQFSAERVESVEPELEDVTAEIKGGQLQTEIPIEEKPVQQTLIKPQVVHTITATPDVLAKLEGHLWESSGDEADTEEVKDISDNEEPIETEHEDDTEKIIAGTVALTGASAVIGGLVASHVGKDDQIEKLELAEDEAAKQEEAEHAAEKEEMSTEEKPEIGEDQEKDREGAETVTEQTEERLLNMMNRVNGQMT